MVNSDELADATADAARQRRQTLLRWLGAGPGALTGAYLLMAAMPLWFPRGAANVNQLVFPLILFPALWALLFFYVCLSRRPGRANRVILIIIVLNAAAISSQVLIPLWGGTW